VRFFWLDPKDKAAAPRGVTLAAALGAATVAAGVLAFAAACMRIRRERTAYRIEAGSTAEHRAQLEKAVEERTRELRRAADALALSEARLRGIFDSATDAILTIDETQTIVLANLAAAQMLRCAPDGLLGSPLDRFIPQPSRERHRRHVEAFGAGAADARTMSPQREVAALRADGDEFPIEAAISHLRLDERHLYTVILRDITDRKRAEAALVESESRIRRVLTLLPEGVFVNSGGQIVFANQAACRILGAEEGALLGRSPLDFMHPDSLNTVKARIAALEAGAPQQPTIQVKMLRADGSVRDVETTAAMAEIDGTLSLLVLLRDVTGLRRVERELAQSHADLQRLMSAQDRVQEDERKRIARELHDDLQQKLAAIMINVSAASAQLQRDPRGAASALAAADELAASAVESTRRIVNDLRPQTLDDLGLAAALQTLAAGFSRASGIHCRVDAVGKAEAQASNRPGLATGLYRIAQESLNNVAKHTRASDVVIELALHGDAGVALRVRDNGQGMGPGTTRKPDSWGLLGMQERMRMLGGALRVHSAPGGGTTVEAIVPMAALAVQEAS
jgi:PAS domain S-box-containing protein